MSKEEIVTIEEQEILNNWVTENQKKFTLNPLNYGYYTHINTINENFKN